MDELISIVIPVYNVGKYLQTCVESVINQTYTNLQIILVNDGSTDRSGEICEEFKKKDERIIVIHKENGGLSDARNYGLNYVVGNYVTFIDSDDYVSTDYVSFLVELLENHNADISICGLCKFIEGETVRISDNNIIKCFTNIEAIEDNFYQKHIENSACGKLYKVEMFENIRYPIGRIYEDLATTYRLLGLATKVVWSAQQKYFYLQRNDSIMHQKFSLRDMDRITISREILEYTKINYPQIENAANSRFFISNIQTLRILPLNDKKYLQEIYEIQKNITLYRKGVLHDKNAKKITRVIALMAYGPIGILQKLGDAYKRVNR